MLLAALQLPRSLTESRRLEPVINLASLTVERAETPVSATGFRHDLTLSKRHKKSCAVKKQRNFPY